MYTGLGSCLSVCGSVCGSHIRARVHVRGRAHPPHLYIYCNRTSLPSFAIRCYGNKGTDWSGCSSQSETRREKREREGKMFACRPNNNSRLKQHIRKQLEYSDKRKDEFRFFRCVLTRIKGLINGCTVEGRSTGQGPLKPFVSLFLVCFCFSTVSKCSLRIQILLFFLSLFGGMRLYWSRPAASIVEMLCANMSMSNTHWRPLRNFWMG